MRSRRANALHEDIFYYPKEKRDFFFSLKFSKSNLSLMANVSPNSKSRQRKGLLDREAQGWQLLQKHTPQNNDLERPNPCTITIRRQVEQTNIDAFKNWQTGIIEANYSFEGFEGATLLKETLQTEVLGDIMFIVILRYASYSAAVQWHESEEREEWLLKLAEINLKSDPIQANINFDVLPVVEVGNIGVYVSGAAVVAPMSRFWFWFSIWMQVYVLVEFFEWLLPKLLDFMWDPETRNFHLWLLVGTFCSTVTIELVTMQLIIKVREWVHLKVLPLVLDSR